MDLLLFFDTTSTYLEIDEPDRPAPAPTKGFRTHGHSKDHRRELPQIVIGLAVTRDGIPIRVWTWPGNASDQELIRQVKEVVLDDGTMRDRFVICRNPEAAERDRSIRAQLLEQLQAAIADSDDKPLGDRLALVQSLRAKPGLARFLRVTGSMQLRVDRAAVAAEEKLDGKFLLPTSDPTLSAEEVALGYKQLLQVERAWRDMRTTLDLRPVYHRRQERIRAHVLLCWLSLLLIRIAENGTGQIWHRLRWELEKMHLGRFSGRAGLVHQRTEATPAQRTILRALGLDEPPRFFHLEATVESA